MAAPHLLDVSVDEIATVFLTVRVHVGPHLLPQKLVDDGHVLQDSFELEDVTRYMLQEREEVQYCCPCKQTTERGGCLIHSFIHLFVRSLIRRLILWLSNL